MGLFEELGIVLKSGEKIIKRGRCKGKVPKRTKIVASAWTGALRIKVNWEKVDGEMVLTNKRLIIVGEDTWERIVFAQDLEFKDFYAIKELGEDGLLIYMNLGTGKLEEMLLRVENASEWADAIRKQCGKK